MMMDRSILSKFLTPEELEFADSIPNVTVSIKELKQQERDGFTELKQDFKSVKVSIHFKNIKIILLFEIYNQIFSY